MKKLLLLILLVSVSSILTAQNQTDSIEISRQFGIVFSQNGMKLTPKQLFDITGSNDQTSHELKVAKTNYTFATIFSCAGGFLIGWPLGTAIGGGKPDWALAGIGAGLVLVALPFNSAYIKHIKKAVGIYNDGLHKSGLKGVNIRMELNCYGAGVKIVF
jgi:hypothetical protein